jgi:biotin synthase
MKIQDLLKKAYNDERLTRDELVHLLSVPSDSADAYAIMAEGNRVSKEVTDGKAEVHAQFALNISPCGCNCLFCSFARVNGVFTEATELTVEETVAYAKQLGSKGANAVYLMTTVKYAFDRFIEMAQEVRKHLASDTMLIANIGDQSRENAKRLKETGFSGVYHALRFREGTDTALDPQKRKESIRNFQEAGLTVGTCVEPIGPEHTNEEIAELIEFTASIDPAYSGAARRIMIPGTEIAQRGIISELRMAHIVAVTRLGMPRSVKGNCTHEPCTLGAAAGASLFWAELGANPRDVKERTEEGRGDSVEHCGTLFWESGWDVWKGPSRYYQKAQSTEWFNEPAETASV